MAELSEDEYQALRERFEQSLAGAKEAYRKALSVEPVDNKEILDAAAKRASAFAKVATWQKALAVLSSVVHAPQPR